MVPFPTASGIFHVNRPPCAEPATSFVYFHACGLFLPPTTVQGKCLQSEVVWAGSPRARLSHPGNSHDFERWRKNWLVVEGAALGTRRPRVLIPKSRQAGAGHRKEGQERVQAARSGWSQGQTLALRTGTQARWREKELRTAHRGREAEGTVKGGQAPGGQRIRLGCRDQSRHLLQELC